jgi:CelD/BcsL family acetyltransferase involved in cellulose biosynthesis
MGLLWRADGTPVAAQYWLLSGGVAALLKLAHDQAALADSPGTVLTALMIRQLIEADQPTSLDFGRGDDPYKQLWASERRQRIGVTLSDPWHPAGFVACVLQAAGRRRSLLPWRSGA